VQISILFSVNKYFQIKVLNPYHVFADKYERDSAVVGINGFLLPVVDFEQKKSRKPFLISCLVVPPVGGSIQF
jgi:hypothetical protein